MAAQPVDHLDISDVKALAPDQRRKKSVQPVEIGQREKDVAAKGLEAAAAVAGAVAQNGAADRIGNARLQSLESGGPATDPLAGDQPDAGRTGLERLHQ